MAVESLYSAYPIAEPVQSEEDNMAEVDLSELADIGLEFTRALREISENDTFPIEMQKVIAIEMKETFDHFLVRLASSAISQNIKNKEVE